MNVSDLIPDRLWLRRIAIITTTTLPESIMNVPVWLSVFHARKKTGRVFLNVLQRIARYGLLNRGKYFAN
jgi:hypothetical protein